MKKVIENETTFVLIEEMLKIGLNNVLSLSVVEPHDINNRAEWTTSSESSEFVRYVVTPQGVEKRTHYILFKLSDLSPEMRAILLDENGKPRELVIDKQRYRERILAAAGCL